MTEPGELPTSERQVLVEFLEHYRAVFAGKAEGLIYDDLNRTTARSTLTLAGLVKHLALVEDSWFTERFAGLQIPEPWASAPFDDDIDWDFHSAPNDTPEALLALHAVACARSRAIVDATPSLDTVSAAPDSKRNLRWVLVHMIEEYARHTGHADLLREAVDGRTGG